VTLSQAGRNQELETDLPMQEAAYDKDPAESRAILTARVLGLKEREGRRIVEWMVEKYGGIAGACVHFAVRHNAARARFYRGVEGPSLAARPPPLLDFGQRKVA
jgi:hypothetical protein